MSHAVALLSQNESASLPPLMAWAGGMAGWLFAGEGSILGRVVIPIHCEAGWTGRD